MQREDVADHYLLNYYVLFCDDHLDRVMADQAAFAPATDPSIPQPFAPEFLDRAVKVIDDGLPITAAEIRQEVARYIKSERQRANEPSNLGPLVFCFALIRAIDPFPSDKQIEVTSHVYAKLEGHRIALGMTSKQVETIYGPPIVSMALEDGVLRIYWIQTPPFRNALGGETGDPVRAGTAVLFKDDRAIGVFSNSFFPPSPSWHVDRQGLDSKGLSSRAR
jgi:hypothetical protein